MIESAQLFVNRKELRAWLSAHHDTASELWIVQYKKASKKVAVDYDTAVEEALCFGWVDGKVKGIDDESYGMRLSPRKPKSNWSPSNIARAKKLLAAKRITSAGKAVLPSELRE